MIECLCAFPAALLENGHLRVLIDVQGHVQVVHLGRIHDVVLHIVLMVDTFEIGIIDTHVIVENCD
jgi:hypothetical protein